MLHLHTDFLRFMNTATQTPLPGHTFESVSIIICLSPLWPKWISSHLSTLNSICQILAHSPSLSISVCRIFIPTSLPAFPPILVSSSNFAALHFGIKRRMGIDCKRGKAGPGAEGGSVSNRQKGDRELGYRHSAHIQPQCILPPPRPIFERRCSN